MASVSKLLKPGGDVVSGIGQGFAEMSRNMRRSILSVSSIMMGVGSVMLIWSLTRGNQDQALKRIAWMGGTNVMTVESLPPRNREQEILFSRSPGLRYDQMARLAEKTANVEYLLPQRWVNSATLQTGHGSHAAPLAAVDWAYFSHFRLGVAGTDSGGTRASAAWARGGKVCLLGDALDREIFGGDSKPGRTLRYQGMRLEVIGTVSARESRDFRRSAVFIPWSLHLMEFAGPWAGMERVAVKVRDPGRMDETVRLFGGGLIREHRGVPDFTISTPEEEMAAAAKANGILKLVGTFVAGMSLAVGAIGILNLMWSSVNNRIREIGIRKAMGATRGGILAQFLTESIMISLLGTLLGLAFGALPALMPEGALPIAPRQTFMDFLICGFAGSAIGIVSGIYPALLASRLSPVESLSHV